VLVCGLGAAIAFRRQKLTEVWHAIRRGSPSEAWAGTARLAAEGWSAVRRHIPIGARPADAQKPDEARGSHKRTKVARK
jgi:hypothetical protein